MTRGVEDGLLILHALSGPDPGDLSTVPCNLDFDSGQPVAGLRVGYFPNWMNENPATEVDRMALAAVKNDAIDGAAVILDRRRIPHRRCGSTAKPHCIGSPASR